MEHRISLAFVRRSPAQRGRLLAILAAVALAALLGGACLSSVLGRHPPAGVQLLPSNASDPPAGDFHYFTSGQWLADLRTLVAACRYLLEPEPA